MDRATTMHIHGIVERADAATKAFVSDYKLASELARLWQLAGYASAHSGQAKVVQKSRSAAARIDQIAALHPDSDSIRRDRMSAWRYVACAWSRQRDDRAAQLAEGVARKVEMLPEPSDPIWTARERAFAWREVAFAWAQDRSAMAFSHAGAARDRIAQLVSLYPDDLVLNEELVTALRETGYALSTEVPDAPAIVLQLTHRVEALEARFPGEPVFTWARVSIYAQAARIFSERGETTQALLATAKAEEIGSTRPQDPLCRTERIMALCYAGEALARSGDSEGAQGAALAIDQLSTTPPLCRLETLQRALARRTTAEALRTQERRPNEARAAAFRAMLSES